MRLKLMAFIIGFQLSITAGSAVAGTYSFGYIPADPKVFKQQPEVPRYRAFLPMSVDLSKYFPKPGFQGDINSCSGWAVGYAARAFYARTVENRDIGLMANVPSPEFIYNLIRDPHNCNSGSLLLDAFNLLKTGSLSAQEFPTKKKCKRPSEAQKRAAKDFRIKRWLAVRPSRIDDVKGQLARGNPVIFGMEVGSQFEHLQSGIVYMGENRKSGSHAMTVVGYSDQRQAFKIINSWGTNWGDGGFGWISYDVFKRDALEAYVIEVGTKEAQISDLKPEDQQPAPKNAEPVVVAPEVAPKPTIKPAPPPSPIEQAENPAPPLERPSNNGDCSYAFSDKKSGRTILAGFVNSEDDLKLLKADWKGYADDFKIEVRPWPQCEVLLNVVSLLDDEEGLSVRTKGGSTRFSDGQEMAFQLKTPVMPSFVYVFYIEADGSVVTLLQPQSDLVPTPRGQTVVFGSGEGGTARYKASSPYGREMVLALSAASPLFDGELPKVQTEREFLSELRRAILYKATVNKGDRRISAAFVGIETEARK